jgi:hypothetical protein
MLKYEEKKQNEKKKKRKKELVDVARRFLVDSKCIIIVN